MGIKTRRVARDLDNELMGFKRKILGNYGVANGSPKEEWGRLRGEAEEGMRRETVIIQNCRGLLGNIPEERIELVEDKRDESVWEHSRYDKLLRDLDELETRVNLVEERYRTRELMPDEKAVHPLEAARMEAAKDMRFEVYTKGIGRDPIDVRRV